jgi:hypothetical protein
MEYSFLSDASHIPVAYKYSILLIKSSASLTGKRFSHTSWLAFFFFLGTPNSSAIFVASYLLGPPLSSPQALFP